MGARWDRFKQESWQMLREKFQQGLDELGNALFNGNGYMPWPGPGRPTVRQEAERQLAVQKEVKAIQAPKAPAVTAHGKSASLYFNPNIHASGKEVTPAIQEPSVPQMTEHEEHAGLYYNPEEAPDHEPGHYVQMIEHQRSKQHGLEL